jgi:hypothetical protein
VPLRPRRPRPQSRTSRTPRNPHQPRPTPRRERRRHRRLPIPRRQVPHARTAMPFRRGPRQGRLSKKRAKHQPSCPPPLRSMKYGQWPIVAPARLARTLPERAVPRAREQRPPPSVPGASAAHAGLRQGARGTEASHATSKSQGQQPRDPLLGWRCASRCGARAPRTAGVHARRGYPYKGCHQATKPKRHPVKSAVSFLPGDGRPRPRRNPEAKSLGIHCSGGGAQAAAAHAHPVQSAVHAKTVIHPYKGESGN